MSDEFFAPPAEEASAAPVWELSGWWRRVGASFIDGMVLWIPLTAIFAIIDSDTVDPTKNTTTSLDLVQVLVGAVVTAVYFMVVMTAWNGQTVGKRALEIRVVREDGQPMDPKFAFYRQTLVIGVLFSWLALLLLYIPTFFNYLWPLWDEKHQALHDKIVHSRVVRAEQVSDPGNLQAVQAASIGQAPFPQAPQAAPAPPVPPAVHDVPPTQVPPPAPPAPPAPPQPGGTPAPYTPPPGFENPVPDDD
jgi:uncharacterized RDD family membrane protein YckC